MNLFEEVIRHIQPAFLGVLGLILVVPGLLLWLGGLRLLRPLAAFSAAGIGLVCVLAFTEHHLVSIALFTLIPAAIALFVEKPIVVLIGAFLAGALVLILPVSLNESVRQSVSEQTKPLPAAEDNMVFEVETLVQEWATWSRQWVKAFWTAIPNGYKMTAIGASICVLVAGILTWRWVCAWACATLGTGMVMLGTTLLIVSKGPQTGTYLSNLYQYFWVVLGGMIVSGTLISRWLGPVKPKQEKSKKTHIQGDEK